MKIRGDRVPGRSGTLCQRTKKKQLQNGQTKEYPLVIGERDPLNILHWLNELNRYGTDVSALSNPNLCIDKFSITFTQQRL